ncbi:MAG: type III pantothenate kinase [Candidatus Limnocylindrales bacterium]
MLVAIDVGNSNVTLGIVRDGEVSSSRHAPTRPSATADELESTLDELMRQDGGTLDETDEMLLASVVPSVTGVLTQVAERRGIALLIADFTNIPIPIRVDQPATVGDDRLLNALAAARLYGKPAIVVDLGTATTFDVVAADGAFIGGAIAPGLGIGLDALAARTAQLPRVALVMPPRAIRRDTVSAMQSGALIGYLGLVRELVRAISAELSLDGGGRPKVILTGGYSNVEWAKAIPGVDVIDPLLTLRGLAILHSEVRHQESVRQT